MPASVVLVLLACCSVCSLALTCLYCSHSGDLDVWHEGKRCLHANATVARQCASTETHCVAELHLRQSAYYSLSRDCATPDRCTHQGVYCESSKFGVSDNRCWQCCNVSLCNRWAHPSQFVVNGTAVTRAASPTHTLLIALLIHHLFPFAIYTIIH